MASTAAMATEGSNMRAAVERMSDGRVRDPRAVIPPAMTRWAAAVSTMATPESTRDFPVRLQVASQLISAPTSNNRRARTRMRAPLVNMISELEKSLFFLVLTKARGVGPQNNRVLQPCMPTIDSFVQVWLVVLALFEVPEILKQVLNQDDAISGMVSNLANARAERHLWAFTLALLVGARVLAASCHYSRAVSWHCAFVHTVEAVALGNEYLVHGAKGNAVIHALIHANAVLFIAWAVMPQADAKKHA